MIDRRSNRKNPRLEFRVCISYKEEQEQKFSSNKLVIYTVSLAVG
jgi:hypothetical protein